MKKIPQLIAASVAAVFLHASTESSALPIPGLFPTGVDNSGSLLGAGASDPHYTLVGGGGAPAFVVNEGFPIGPWMGNGPTSKWIAPMADQSGGSNAGDYSYRISFDLDGLKPDTAQITGQWSSDNVGTAILLNGNPTGFSHSGNFGAFEPFAIGSGFISGLNTLDFVVNNAGASANPTGVRIELGGMADVEPPPGTPPSILSDPQDSSVSIGGSASLSVSATGASPLSYQWRRGAADIAGATAPTLNIASVSPGDAGAYSVVVTNPWGSATSAAAQLEISLDLPTDEELEREPLGPSRRRSGLAFSEIMYQPRARGDGRVLEFVEIYNSNPWPEPLGGYRLGGGVEFSFPPGTSIGAEGFLVIAAAPSDVATEYGIPAPLGPWSGALSNSGESLRLIKRSGGVVLDLSYSDDAPWPIEAAGAGHSMILARPSFGEDDPRAWARSAAIGGSPGADEAPVASALEHVSINEVSASRSGSDLTDFVELHNRSRVPLDLSGCILSDDPDVDRFVIPPGTTIGASGYVVFRPPELGFVLTIAGDSIYFKNAGGTRVIDALRFGGRTTGGPIDGDGARLAAFTPGQQNAPLFVPRVVINEIMFNPAHGDASEFVELFNRSSSTVDLSGVAFIDGIDFSFPEGTWLEPGEFIVVAEDRVRLLADHPGLDPVRVFGDFDGSLSDRGERVALAQPVRLRGGRLTYGLIDEVRYRDGGRWGDLADGGGSSLELTDSFSDNRSASNWATSDETAKAPWTEVEHSGTLELGKGSPDQLQMFLLGAGEALVDDVELVPLGGANLVTNPEFSADSNWFFQGTHAPSSIAGGHLHLRAVRRGDLGSNRIRTVLSSPPGVGERATIRARARWLGGSPYLLIRVLGNYLEAAVELEVPRNLGTPGAPNSRLLVNAGPVIEDVTHRPVVPALGEAVRVTARVDDPHGLAQVVLNYRSDPQDAGEVEVLMRDDGLGGDLFVRDGIFTAVIPGRSTARAVAFRVEAEDAHPTFPEGSRFPTGEGLIRWGEGDYPGGFANYRLWMTEATRTTWTNREKMSNQPLGVTFVYADQRVIYGAGSQYSGSAYTSPAYTSPTGRICGYDVFFPRDDMLLGDDRMILDFPVRDPTAQREQLMYWFCDQSGLPNNYRRYVNLFVNGIGQRQRSGFGTNSNAIYTDIQQPNSDSVNEWFPDGTGGNLIKGSYWHEFDNGGARIDPANPPTHQIFNGEDGSKSLARYRWNWRPRAVSGSPNDLAQIFARVDALNQSGDALAPAVQAVIDIDQWMRTFAVNDLASNWDSFGNPGGKNTFHYRPPDGRWQLMSWDFDVGLGVFNDPVDSALFSVGDPAISNLYNQPALMRHYWHALREAVDSFFQSSSVAPVLDAKWAALQAAGVPLTSPDVPSGSSNLSIPDWIDQRRNFLLGQLATFEAGFAITTNGGGNFSTGDSLVELEGTAGLAVHSLAVEGDAHPFEWTSQNAWRLSVALPPGQHTLTLSGIDRAGAPVAGESDTITVTVTAGGDSPIGKLVINEIMYHPDVPDAEYVEIHNRSTTTAFDLGGWRLNGAGFTFPAGASIAPGGYLLLVEDRQAFGEEFGWAIPVAGEFPGSLDNGGEALTLLQPGALSGEFVEIDRVRYSPHLPWAAGADGLGPALQLVDPARDNSRASNWSAPAPGGGGPETLVAMTANWRYNQNGFVPNDWNTLGFDDASWPAGDALLYVEGAALPAPKNTPLSLGPTSFYFRSKFTHTGAAVAALALSGIIDDGAVFYLNGVELMRLRLPDGAINANTLASPFVDNAVLEGPFVVPAPSLVAGENVLAVEVHQSVSNSSDIVMGVELAEAGAAGIDATPGAANVVPIASHPAVPSLSLNELRPVNPDGVVDNAGEFEPWVEIFNGSANAASLDGWFLSDDESQLGKWAFAPGASLAAGGFGLVWLDGEVAENTAGDWHANFLAPGGGGSLLLSYQPPGGVPLLIDALAFSNLATDKTLGRFPDGNPDPPLALFVPTPAAPNDNSVPLPPVTINEWMAANDGAVADPADGDFDDWFELFNAGAQAVDLSGFTLTDDLAEPDKFTIPGGTSIAPGGFLLVWADNEPAQYQAGGDLHASFSLRASGEAIGLFAPDGREVDSVVFSAQSGDVSDGRWPDGQPGEGILRQSAPTPGAANDLTPAGAVMIPDVSLAWNAARDGLVLTFTTEFGRYYSVQYSTDMSAGSWQDISHEIPGKGDPIEFQIAGPIAPRAAFYRVAILTQPST